MKERLDKLLVKQALAPSREKAQALIMADRVRVNGLPARKAGSQIAPGAAIEVTGPDHPYVSRGGVKLEGAMKALGVVAEGLSALDVGASSGGFTDCLLAHGARHVFAVDVGYGQFAWKLREDPRVTLLERTNIRHLDPAALGEAVQLIVVDVSFISLTKVLGGLLRFLAPGGQVLALVKPQFEAGREQVRRGGRVTDPEVQAEAVAKVGAAGEGLGLSLTGTVPSSLLGKKSGNREFFVLWRLCREA